MNTVIETAEELDSSRISGVPIGSLTVCQQPQHQEDPTIRGHPQQQNRRHQQYVNNSFRFPMTTLLVTTCAMLVTPTHESPRHSHGTFPVDVSGKNKIFHSVRGIPVQSELVDTGAAATLMGTHTLCQVKSLYKHLSNDISLGPPTQTFTGIGGVSQPLLGSGAVPLDLPWPGKFKFVHDFIGGDGSLCPGL